MTGAGTAACVDYVLRLTERFDGRATHIDGSFVAARAPSRTDGGFQVTRDVQAAMRFRSAEAADLFCAPSEPDAPPSIDTRLTQLLHVYDVAIVVVDRAAPCAVKGRVPSDPHLASAAVRR